MHFRQLQYRHLSDGVIILEIRLKWDALDFSGIFFFVLNANAWSSYMYMNIRKMTFGKNVMIWNLEF